jgi:hypothetical protein
LCDQAYQWLMVGTLGHSGYYGFILYDK